MSDTNPFHQGNAEPTREDRIAEAIKSADAAEPAEASTPSTTEDASTADPEVPAEGEAPDSVEETTDLFPEVAADEPAGTEAAEEAEAKNGEGEEDSSDLFEDDDDDDDDASKPKTKTVPYKRLQKVIAERNAARDKLDTAQAALSKANALNAEVSKLYSQYERPADQLTWDVRFLEKWQELSSSGDARFQEIGQLVIDAMDGKKVPTVSDSTTSEPAPERDPAIAAIVERQANDTINQTLAAVKPQFQKLIASHIKASGTDLAALTSADVKRLANDWRRDNGFNAADLLQAPKAQDPDPPKPKPSSPNTSASGSAETRSGSSPAEEKPKAPRDSHEWRQQRDARLQERIRRLGLS